MEAGTFAVLNPDLMVPELTKLLSTGDDCCLATIELPLAKKEAGRVSPHATPDAFPPVLKAPGLEAKLAAQGIKSVLSALWTILTRGPEQPMHWYEFIRYNPEAV
jgi:hypothetical protein